MDTGWRGGFVLFCFYRRVRIGGALILSAANASGGFLRSFRRYRREPLALRFTLQQATGDEVFFIKWGCSIGGSVLDTEWRVSFADVSAAVFGSAGRFF